jgi:hypothetical protein
VADVHPNMAELREQLAPGGPTADNSVSSVTGIEWHSMIATPVLRDVLLAAGAVVALMVLLMAASYALRLFIHVATVREMRSEGWKISYFYRP